MFTKISSIVLVLAVVLGGGVVTAYAAQGSLPNDALHPVKLFLEDTTFSLTSDLETQVSLLTTFANNRIDEIVTMSLAGEAVPQDVVDDLQADLDAMLSLAAEADDAETEDALKYIRQNLRDRDQLMTMAGQPEDVDPALGQLRAMLQAQHQRAQIGVEDPLQFKLMFRHNWEEVADETEESTGPKGNQNGDCTEEDCEPQGPKGPNETAGGGNEAAPGPKYEWEDTGNENPGNAAPGNADPGNAAPGNADPGTGDGNADPGNAAPGNADPGNAAPGNPGTGGDPDPGDPDPGDPDPGNPNPGRGGDPGNPEPGNPDPGNPDPGKGGGGDDETP
jgi:hypothetical protein